MESKIGSKHCGFELVAQKPYSAVEADSYLSIVGGVREGDYGWQAVTWCYNATSGGFGHGDYSAPVSTRGEALRAMAISFNYRGLQSGSELIVLPSADAG